jgi:hypothetical protein
MVPTPLSIGLTLCDNLIIEERTRKLTLVGTFPGFRSSEFPCTPDPFYVSASLIGGQGEGELTLTVTQLETDDELFAIHRRISFSDRLAELRVAFRLRNCTFPEPGAYSMTLLMDGEWVAQRRFEVSYEESDG